MTLKTVIDELTEKYGGLRMNFFYHADIEDELHRIYEHEFVGVSSWHDNYFDTSEDPDGWSLEDTVVKYEEELRDNELLVDIDLGKWN